MNYVALVIVAGVIAYMLIDLVRTLYRFRRDQIAGQRLHNLQALAVLLAEARKRANEMPPGKRRDRLILRGEALADQLQAMQRDYYAPSPIDRKTP